MALNRLEITTDGKVGVLRGNGDGTFQSAKSYSSGANESASVAIGDLSGDGRVDLAVAEESEGVTTYQGSAAKKSRAPVSAGRYDDQKKQIKLKSGDAYLPHRINAS